MTDASEKENKMDTSTDSKKPLSENQIYPGKVLIDYSKTNIEINKDREVVLLSVTNLSNEPIVVGSHFNFIEANKFLKFDRSIAYGMRLVCDALFKKQLSYFLFISYCRIFHRENVLRFPQKIQ